MGFWSSLFGTAAANMIRDAKKEEKVHQQWNSQFDEIGEIESDFNSYLTSVGAKNASWVISVDWDNLSQRSVQEYRRSVSSLRTDVEKYLAVGGDPSYIFNVHNLTGHIKKLEYLKKHGMLDKQREFLDMSIEQVIEHLEAESHDMNALNDIIRRSGVISANAHGINQLSGVEFELLCQQLLEKMGYNTQLTKASGDGGIDIIATINIPLMQGKYVIQCKRYSSNIGEPILRDLYGVVMSENANKGILMTTSDFTQSAKTFAAGKQLELIDGNTLYDLLVSNGLINSNNVKNNSTFDIGSALPNWARSDYDNAARKLSRDPIGAVCGMAEAILATIRRNDVRAEYDNSMLCKMEVALEDTLQPIIGKPVLASQKGRYLYYMSLLMVANACVYSGQLCKAYMNYIRVLDGWKDLNAKWGRAQIAVAAISICNLLGRSDEAERVYFSNRVDLMDYKSDQDGLVRFYRKEIEETPRFKDMYTDQLLGVEKKIKDLTNYKQMVNMVYFFQDNYYSEGINEWGECQIGGGENPFVYDSSLDVLSTQSKYGGNIFFTDAAQTIAKQKEMFDAWLDNGKTIAPYDDAEVKKLLSRYTLIGEIKYSEIPISLRKGIIPTEFEWLSKEIELVPEWNNGDISRKLNRFITDYNVFYKWMSQAQKSPNSLRAKCKTIEALHEAIIIRLQLGETSDYGSDPLQTMHTAAKLLHALVLSVKKEEYKTDRDEKKQYLYYMCLLMEGEIAFWLGHPEIAVASWKEVLEDYKYLKKDNRETYVAKKVLIQGIWTCLNYCGISEKMDDFNNCYKKEIDYYKDHLQKEIQENSDPTNWLQTETKKGCLKEYNVFCNPRTARNIVRLGIFGRNKDSEESVLLCEGNHGILIKDAWSSVIFAHPVKFTESKDLYFLGNDEPGSAFYSEFLILGH